MLWISISKSNLVIEESEDDKTHLTYYQGKEASERIVTQPIKEPKDSATKTPDNFRLEQWHPFYLELFDNEGGRSTVTLSLPKGTNFQPIKATAV